MVLLGGRKYPHLSDDAPGKGSGAIDGIRERPQSLELHNSKPRSVLPLSSFSIQAAQFDVQLLIPGAGRQIKFNEFIGCIDITTPSVRIGGVHHSANATLLTPGTRNGCGRLLMIRHVPQKFLINCSRFFQQVHCRFPGADLWRTVLPSKPRGSRNEPLHSSAICRAAVP
jgi:hypothetical protein